MNADYTITSLDGGRFLIEANTKRARRTYARRGPDYRWVLPASGVDALRVHAADVGHSIHIAEPCASP